MPSVLVVDDSAFVRKALTRVLRASPDITDVTAVGSVHEALAQLAVREPDLLTLDVDLPDMNGLSALREIARRHPTVPVVMLSALTQKGASVTFEALAAGAVDFIDKSSFSVLDLDRMSRELLDRVRLWSRRRPTTTTPAPTTAPVPTRSPSSPDLPSLDRTRFDLCVVGASTGGPAAIESLARRLPPDLPFPVLVVQHMPVGFTRSFAERLDTLSALQVAEAADGDALLPGSMRVAPAGFQLRVVTSAGGAMQMRLTPGPDGHRHAPSVDAAMTSAALACPGRVLGVLLTGMGEDGASGMRAVREGGGITIAESERTCAVFGMPRAAIALGAAVFVLPLPDIVSVLSGGAPQAASRARAGQA